MPYSSSFDNNLVIDSVKGFFYDPEKGIPFTNPLSVLNLTDHAFVELMSAVSVECFGRKPEPYRYA